MLRPALSPGESAACDKGFARTDGKSPAAEEHVPDNAENLSSIAEEESPHSDNHANISNPTDLQKTAEPEAEVHENVTHEQESAEPVVEEHTFTISQ